MCFLIHQKIDVNTPSDEPQNCCPSLYMQNEWSLDKFGETMLMAAEASLYSANRRARNCDTKPHECPKPHKATDNWRSKVLGFLSQLHEMHCESLDYTARGFWASDVQSHQPGSQTRRAQIRAVENQREIQTC